MCRCGVSCDYIYNKLMIAESQGKTSGYKLSVDILFGEDESEIFRDQCKDIATDHGQNEI